MQFTSHFLQIKKSLDGIVGIIMNFASHVIPLGRVRVYPRIHNYVHALSKSNRVGFGCCPWAYKCTQTLSIRVGYPRVSMSMDKIVILNDRTHMLLANVEVVT